VKDYATDPPKNKIAGFAYAIELSQIFDLRLDDHLIQGSRGTELSAYLIKNLAPFANSPLANAAAQSPAD